MDLHYYRLEAEILTEVHLANLAVGEDRFRRTGRDDFTLVEYIGALADAQCLADIVIRDEHADVACGELADDALDVKYGDRIDAGERLVEQHESRRRGERARDLHAT